MSRGVHPINNPKKDKMVNNFRKKNQRITKFFKKDKTRHCPRSKCILLSFRSERDIELGNFVPYSEKTLIVSDDENLRNVRTRTPHIYEGSCVAMNLDRR